MKIALRIFLFLFFGSFYYLLIQGYQMQSNPYAVYWWVACIGSFLVSAVIGIVLSVKRKQ